MRSYLTFSSLLAVAWVGLASRPAHAQSACSADSDCVKGWTCQVSGGTGCAAPACPPGEKCEPQPIDCVSEVYTSCQPAACQADSDCAEGMVCYTHTESNCAPTACAAGQECPVPVCEARTVSACVPRYVLPCTTASDCGPGFQCELGEEQCTCSSSGSAGRSGDGDQGGAPAPAESTCTCEPSTEMRCRAATVNCAVDSDCATGWTCAVVGSTSDCRSAPEQDPGSGARGGATPTPECRPSANIKQCVPPYYTLIPSVLGIDRDSSQSPTAGTGDVASGNGAIAPTAESGKGDGASTSSAGCAVAPGSRSGSALALLGVLGLFGALRRRRVR
jgi:MYXO-CTERM domain-containing protein